MAGTSLGASINISASRPATYSQAGFEDAGVVFTEIENALVNTITLGGTYGSTSDVILSTGETVESKTSLTSTEFTISLFEDESNAGITILDAAFESRDYFAFKIVSGSGNTKYIEARVMSKNFEEGDTESHEKVMYTVKPRSLAPIVVAA